MEYVKLVPTTSPSATPPPTTIPVIDWVKKNTFVAISIGLAILIFIWMRPVTFPGDIFSQWMERIRIALLGVPPPIQQYVDIKISSEVASQVAAQLAAMQPSV